VWGCRCLEAFISTPLAAVPAEERVAGAIRRLLDGEAGPRSPEGPRDPDDALVVSLGPSTTTDEGVVVQVLRYDGLDGRARVVIEVPDGATHLALRSSATAALAWRDAVREVEGPRMGSEEWVLAELHRVWRSTEGLGPVRIASALNATLGRWVRTAAHATDAERTAQPGRLVGDLRRGQAEALLTTLGRRDAAGVLDRALHRVIAGEEPFPGGGPVDAAALRDKLRDAKKRRR